MRRIALKVDVDTLRGTLDGVPALAERLLKLGVQASFFFSVGPDNTGRAIRRVFRPGFLKKVQRTSVVSHYGLRTLTSGLLWPGPRIGQRAGHVMREVQAAGFEVGVHAYDHVRWQDFVTRRNGAWTGRELGRAHLAYREALGEAPHAHAAAGWQLNAATLWLEGQMAFDYASDTRGQEPFLPRIGPAEGACPQLPTTLPTLDELIGLDGMTPAEACGRLYDLSHESLPQGHVFTLHAELEGMAFLEDFSRLIERWRKDGFEFVTLADIWRGLDRTRLPRHEIRMQAISGRAGLVACQVPLAA